MAPCLLVPEVVKRQIREQCGIGRLVLGLAVGMVGVACPYQNAAPRVANRFNGVGGDVLSCTRVP